MPPLYFRRRRAQLKRRKVCTRCAATAAAPGHAHCPECLTIMQIKRSRPPEAIQAKAQRLLQRLDLIDQARRAVQEELDRLT